jgi:hypothetical protein
VQESSILNRQNTNDNKFQAALNNFANFAGSDAIDAQTKQHLLTMFAQAISEADDTASACTDMMQTLGMIGKTINLKNYSELGWVVKNTRKRFDPTLGSIYQWWLPKCENLDQLNKAARPDRAFLANLAQMRLIAGERGVASFLEGLRSPAHTKVKPAILLEPIDFPISERLNWVKNTVRERGEMVDANGLLEMTVYVLSEVLDWKTLEGGLFGIPEVAGHLPELKDISDRAEDERNDQLYQWAQLAGLLMLNTDKSVRESVFFKGMLDDIAKVRGEQSRVLATVCLLLGMRNPDMAEELKSFSVQFKPKHSKIFAASLFSLTDNNKRVGELATLIKTVQDHRFRDTKKALSLLTFISEMALVKSLSAKEKWEIVKVLTHDDEEAKHVKDGMTWQMTSALGLAELAELADGGTDDSENAIAALKAIRNLADATDAGKIFWKVMFSIPDGESDEFEGKYRHYLDTSRNPTALLSFAKSIYMGIKEPEVRNKVMGEIALLAKGLIANDGGKTLKQIRYSTEGNDHNAWLQKKAPLAWAHWKEEMRWEKDIEYTAGDLEVKVSTANYLKEKIVDDSHVDAGTFPLLRPLHNRVNSWIM